jgi:aspartyl-tRNA(Asn)/glutamyl-tRNA(Gln) amidotransferase subunit C
MSQITVDVASIAALARLSLSPEEIASLQQEVTAILGFVEEIQSVATGALVPKAGELRNVLREDVATIETGSYTETLLKAAPHRKGDYVSVKQVISGGKHAVRDEG